tara:strand:+ start:3472 stop:3753 length:282 start_codon:yes stop_codon:yes gene_type:complete
VANQKASCKGKPSANFYSNGCRCAGCREAWRVHSVELNDSKRKNSKYKLTEVNVPVQAAANKMKSKPTGSRDKPIVYSDAFTREEIMRAREKA